MIDAIMARNRKQQNQAILEILNKVPPVVYQDKGKKMAHRTVIVEVKVKLVIKADDDALIQNVINEMEYSFTDTTTKADIEDSEVVGYEVVDSR